MRHRNRLGLTEIFVGTYLAALLFYPVAEEPARYALPLLPLLLLGLFRALLSNPGSPWRAQLAGTALFLIAYLPQYLQASSAEAISVTGPEARALYQKIDAIVPRDAVVLCAKPTIIALHGQRQATNAPKQPSPDQFWHFVQERRASWLIELQTPFYEPLSTLMPALADGLDPVFRNRLFALYRLHPP